jgi:hypothetical protein
MDVLAGGQIMILGLQGVFVGGDRGFLERYVDACPCFSGTHAVAFDHPDVGLCGG